MTHLHAAVLFLDVDGVLNSRDYMHNRRHIRRPSAHSIDALTIPRLNEVLRRTGAKIVVSSSWRILHDQDEMQVILTTHGVECEVIGCTPHLLEPIPDLPEPIPGGGMRSRHRGYEIQAWLNEHPEVVRFAIVDDESDMVHLKHKLVQTSWAMGLLDCHIEPLVKMLMDDTDAAHSEIEPSKKDTMR